MISVGVDLGTYSVKVAMVKALSKGYELVSFEEFPLSLDPTRDKEIERLDILRNLSSRLSGQNAKFVFCVAQDKVSVRPKTFPFKERFKIQKSLAFELEEDIPFNQEEAIFDAKILSFAERSANVLAVACPTHQAKAVLQVGKDSGIDIEILGVEGFALANIFEKWFEAPPLRLTAPAVLDENSSVQSEKTIVPIKSPSPLTPADIVLDLGHRTTNVLIRSGDLLLDIAVLPWGGSHLINAVASQFSLHPIEAAKEFQRRGQILLSHEGASAEEIAMSQVLKSQIDVMAQRLNLILMNLKGSHSLKFEQIITLGGLSQLRNFGPYLTQKVEIATNRLKTISAHPGFTFGEARFASSGVALGLALEGLKRPLNPPINLRKGELATQNQSLQVFWKTWGPTLQIATAAFVAFFVYAWVREDAAATLNNVSIEKLQTLATEVTGLKGSKATSAALEKFIQEQKTIESNIKNLDKVKTLVSPLDILKRISEVVPKQAGVKINIKKYAVQDSQVTLEGEITPSTQIESLANQLRPLAKGGKLLRNNPQFQPTLGSAGFSFSFGIERFEGETL